jgi:hypothetical protein
MPLRTLCSLPLPATPLASATWARFTGDMPGTISDQTGAVLNVYLQHDGEWGDIASVRRSCKAGFSEDLGHRHPGCAPVVQRLVGNLVTGSSSLQTIPSLRRKSILMSVAVEKPESDSQGIVAGPRTER